MTAPTATDPVDRIRQALLERGLSVRNDRGHKLSAQCPAHEDKHPSLDVATGKNGDAILICRAGCDTATILAALDLHPRDLFATPRSNGRHDKPLDAGQPRQHVADYIYTVNGDELVRKRRYHLADGRKTFTIQHRPDPDTAWRNGQGGLTPDPYQADTIATTAPMKMTFVVEGEKDCDRLHQLGLAATTNIGGALKWPQGWGEKWFTGRQVAVLADNDDAGHTHAEQVAADLHGHAGTVRVVHLSDLPPKGDVSDWLDAGHSVDELKAEVAAAPLWEPPQPEPSRFQLISIDDLFGLPEPGWLIEQILPQQSFGLVVAPPKQGKTYLVLDWLMHIAGGIDWHHGEPVTPGHVVYVTGEGVTGLARRIRAWQTVHGTPDAASDRFHIVTTMPRVARDGELDELVREIDASLGDHQPAVIAFDTYARFAAGLDENSAQDMGQVCAHLEDLRDRYGCTVVAAHHTTKDGSEFRGSSAIDGALDFMTTTKIVEGATPADPDLLSIKSKYMKSWEPHQPLTLEFRKAHESGALVVIESLRSDLVQSGVLIETARVSAQFDHGSITEDGPPWVRTSVVRAGTDLTPNEFTRSVKALVTDGLLEARGVTNSREIRFTERGWLLHSINAGTFNHGSHKPGPSFNHHGGGSLDPPVIEKAGETRGGEPGTASNPTPRSTPTTIEEIL